MPGESIMEEGTPGLQILCTGGRLVKLYAQLDCLMRGSVPCSLAASRFDVPGAADTC